MKKQSLFCAMILLLALVVAGCGSPGQNAGGDGNGEATATGTLQFVANGEDFIRQGMTSKDGWNLTFDHVYVNLSGITAYQADPPFDPDGDAEVQAEVKVETPGTQAVDLAEGDENAPPVPVCEAPGVPAGHYNAISWEMVRASEGPAAGYSLVIMGQAEKDGRTVEFVIKDENEYVYTGGEYIGDERKGIVQEGGTADLEMTFHFDHIFGDAGTPADDELNVGAPGFEPFAALAEGDRVDVDMATLQEKMHAGDFAKLEAMLPTLGHVGEGHCRCVVK